MKKLQLLISIFFLGQVAYAGNDVEDFNQKKANRIEYRANCPGGDMSGKPSSYYQRSHQEYDARVGCVHPDYGVDVGVIPAVMMGEYMMTDYSRHSHVLTAGLAPCVAITFYDPDTKTGVLAHLPPSAMFYSKNPNFSEQRADDSHDKKFFNDIVAAFEKKGIPRNRLQVHVVGNSLTRNGLSKTLGDVFKSAGILNVQFDGVRDKGYDGAPLEGLGSLKIFDLKTGQIKNFHNEDFPTLDVSNWISRIDKKNKNLSPSKPRYLLPSPGSIDQISSSRNQTKPSAYSGTR